MPAKLEPPPDAADHDVRVGAGERHLLLRLLPDHGLVQQHVVQDRAERVLRVVAGRCILHGLRDRDAERARRARVGREDRAARVRLVGRARHDLTAPQLDQRAPVGLAVVRGAHHVDLDLEAEQRARVGQRRAPLPRPRLGREPRHALRLGVPGLRDRRVRLVRAGRRDALVLVEDARARPQRTLEAEGAHQRRRAPHRVDLAHLVRDRDEALLRDLLADDLHREERREIVGAYRLPGSRVQRRWRSRRQIRGDVVPAGRDVALAEQDAAVGHWASPPDSGGEA